MFCKKCQKETPHHYFMMGYTGVMVCNVCSTPHRKDDYHWHPDINKPDEINAMRLGSCIEGKEPDTQESWMKFFKENTCYWFEFTEEQYQRLSQEAKLLCIKQEECKFSHLNNGTVKLGVANETITEK